jgi:outer membrane protein insertion porin family
MCLLIRRVSGIGDFMGGDLHWSTGLSLLAPIPKRPDWPVKCHMFVNAGRLTRLDSS